MEAEMSEANMPAVLDDRFLQNYPDGLVLEDGTELTLAPMVPSDWSMLERFLNEIPEQDRQFLRHDLSDPAIVEQWCRDLNYRHVFPLLAWNGAQIVADATLHQDPGLWTAHVGKIRLMVHPAYRGRGIGTRMAEHLLKLSKEIGLHIAVGECAAEQKEMIGLLDRLGFEETIRLPEFVRDRRGGLHDMLLKIRRLS